MRTPAGSVVTATGDLGTACRTVTMEAPPAALGAATFRTAAEIHGDTGEEHSDARIWIYLNRCVNLPGLLAAAANGFPVMAAVGEGTNVMPDSGIPWLAGAAATTGMGLLGELAPGVAMGTGLEAGLEAGEVAAGVAGMSYFCSCSR